MFMFLLIDLIIVAVLMYLMAYVSSKRKIKKYYSEKKCEPLKLCNPESVFDIIERCKICGKYM